MKKLLFGSLSYESQEEYLKFLQGLDQVQAVAMLVASAAYAQGRGIFSMEESEVVINSIRKLVPEAKLQEITKPTDDGPTG